MEQEIRIVDQRKHSRLHLSILTSKSVSPPKRRKAQPSDSFWGRGHPLPLCDPTSDCFDIISTQSLESLDSSKSIQPIFLSSESPAQVSIQKFQPSSTRFRQPKLFSSSDALVITNPECTTAVQHHLRTTTASPLTQRSPSTPQPQQLTRKHEHNGGRLTYGIGIAGTKSSAAR